MAQETTAASIDLSTMSLIEMVNFKFAIDNHVRQRRVVNVNKALNNMRDLPERTKFLRELLSRELSFSIPRNIFIDEYLDQLEIDFE